MEKKKNFTWLCLGRPSQELEEAMNAYFQAIGIGEIKTCWGQQEVVDLDLPDSWRAHQPQSHGLWVELPCWFSDRTHGVIEVAKAIARGEQLLTLDMCTQHTPEGNFSQPYPYIYFEGEWVGEMMPGGVAWLPHTVQSARKKFATSDWGIWWNGVEQYAIRTGLRMPSRHLVHLRNPDSTPIGLLKFFAAQEGKDFGFMVDCVPPDRLNQQPDGWNYVTQDWYYQVSAALGKVVFGSGLPDNDWNRTAKNAITLSFELATYPFSVVNFWAKWQKLHYPYQLEREKRDREIREQIVKAEKEKMFKDLKGKYLLDRQEKLKALDELQEKLSWFKTKKAEMVILQENLGLVNLRISTNKTQILSVKFDLYLLKIKYKQAKDMLDLGLDYF